MRLLYVFQIVILTQCLWFAIKKKKLGVEDECCHWTVWDLEQLHSAEVSAQHNQCPSVKCNKGSMRFGTQRTCVSARACVIVSTNVIVFWCTERLYVYYWAHTLHIISMSLFCIKLYIHKIAISALV